MLTLVCAVVAIVCAFGWYCAKVSVMGLVIYIFEKYGTAPDPEELRRCNRRAAEKMRSKKS